MNRTSEEYIIGALIQEPSRVLELKEADFIINETRAIYNAINSLYRSDEPADIYTISEKTQFRLERIIELRSNVPTLQSFEHHKRKLKDEAEKRRLFHLLEDAKRGMDTNDIENIKNSLIAEIEKPLGEDCVKTKPVIEYLDEFLRNMNEKNPSEEPLSTGLLKLNDKLGGGLYPGLYCLGGISGLGKTALAVQIADYVALSGNKVIYFSLEMSRNELMARSIVREGFIHSQNKQALKHIGTKEVLKGGLSENIQDLARGIGVYTNLSHNLTIVEGNFDTGVDEIRDFTRREMNRTGKAPLVIVDYLQIIKGKDKATTKESTDYIITELKRTSRALNIPLLAISSFNRNSYNSKVSYSSFKESGGIEYSCDVLMGMELSVMKELDLSKKGESDKNNARIEAEIQKTCRKVDLVILKNRNGSPFQRVSLDFYGKISLLNEC